MAHNVPGVCDGLTARIRALRSSDQGWQTVGGVERGRRSRPSETEPRSRQRRRSVNSPVMCSGRVPRLYTNPFLCNYKFHRFHFFYKIIPIM
jgi:hypothetical protein